MTLMTIGYEGLDISTFLAQLKANKVQTLVDVRELPLSRKKGFSKSALADATNRAGISYVHMPALGCPREIRKDYYDDRNWGRYKKRFNAYLESQQRALDDLIAVAEAGKSCLVCFEADYEFCHRSLITAALTAARKIGVKHLRARVPAPTEGLQPAFA